MPIISGNTHALMPAQLNRMRLGASRLGYFQPTLTIKLNGADVTSYVRQAGFALRLSLNGEADALALKIEGLIAQTVILGMYLELYLGVPDADHLLFGGNIQTADLSFESENSATPIMEIAAVSFHWVLADILVLSSWGSMTVADLLTALRDGWAPSLELDIASDIASVVLDEFTSTDNNLRDVFDRIAERTASSWRIVANPGGTRVIKFFREATATASEVTRPTAGLGVRQLRQRSDASSIVSRIWSVGGGSTTLIQVPPNPAGVSFPIADGSLLANAAGLIISDSEIGDITCTPYLISGVSRFTYESVRHVANSDVTTVTANAAALSLTLSVAELGIFPGTGWAKVNDKCFRYFGRTAVSGPGDLQLPNVYAHDSLTVNVKVGDTVTPLSCIENVTGQAELGLGDDVNIIWKIECTRPGDFPVDAAITSTVQEAKIEDGRLSYQETLDRGVGELIRYFNPIVTLSWTTEDATMMPGRAVTVNASTGALANTYLIQSVTITRAFLPPDTFIFPTRAVEASSVKETFAALMRRIRGN